MGIREDLDEYKAQANRAEVIARQCLARMEVMEKELDRARSEVNLARIAAYDSKEYIKKTTNVDVDVSPSTRGEHKIILSGTYKNKDFVKIFRVPGDSFDYLIKQIRYISQYANVSNIDAPMTMRDIIENRLTTY